MTLVNNPWKTAELSPARMAISDGSQEWTFSELATAAERIAGHLARLGVAEGMTISTSGQPSAQFFALAMSALRYGYDLVPIPGWCDSATRARLRTDANVFLHIEADSDDTTRDVETASMNDIVAPCDMAIEPASQAGCLSLITSATTAEPIAVKGIRPWYQYRGVATNAKYGAGLQSGPHLMANATFHLGTLGPALHSLQAGSGIVIQRDWSPDLFRELVDRHHVDSTFVAPKQLREIIDARSIPRRQNGEPSARGRAL